MLPKLQAEEWLRLDGQMHDIFYELRRAYHFHAMPPSPTWTFGYLRPHRTRGILSICLEKSRKWFVVWLALLSFCIAAAEGREMERGEHDFARQNWINKLVDKCAHVQIDHAWIDLLLDSSVPSFSSNISRTGTFLNLAPGTSEGENMLQPDVKWFIQYSVPVWYRWDKHLASSTKTRDLAPLEFQLQEADTFMRKSPSPPALIEPINAVGSPESHKRKFSTVAMDNFFKLRDERNARTEQNETPQQRALRLQREKNPPTTKTRVFEWTENSEGEFVCEELIGKALRKQALEYYHGNQLRYDSFTNEWHACELWDDFEDDEDSDIFFTYEGDDCEPQPPSPAPMQAYDDDALLDNVRTIGTGDHSHLAGQIDRRALKLQEELLHIATVYFGYTPCIPLPNVNPLEETRQKKVCRLLGLSWKQVEPVKDAFSFPAVAAVADFCLRLAGNVEILPDEWDLCDTNRQPVVQTPRFKRFQPVVSIALEKPTSTLYMLDLGLNASAPWKLAMKNAADALMVCRLDQNLNEYGIVDFLLTNGIGFHTLQPSGTVLRAPGASRPSLAPLSRLEGHKFAGHDYIAYREHCHAIISHPRGRAALMHGHFMWRIAIRSVKWEDVYKGPSGWSTNPDEMLVVKDSSGNEYIDDKLTMAEQEALCGTYHCLTGKNL